MIEMFGFSPKEFSDDELVARIAELARRIVWFNRMGQGHVSEQLRQQQFMCEQEQIARAYAPRIAKLAEEPPVVVESDPDLAQESKRLQEEKAEREAPKKTPVKKPFTAERLRPTTNPTVERQDK